MKTVTVLGATGSIGLSTLDVIARHPDRFRVHGLSAHSRIDQLFELAVLHRPEVVAVSTESDATSLRQRLASQRIPTEVLSGPQALDTIAEAPEVDLVMAAIVGAAGLPSALAAARAGKCILLANKESLVMGGDVFLEACRQGAATVLPIDSEHNAVFQCLPARHDAAGAPPGIRRILLTASGGPFRLASTETIETATPEQAIAHPRWSMGRKISVDSATMMNKGLELIEAVHLFSVPPGRIDVLVHPQSIIHSLVAYDDGSVLAQLGLPDMRTPISFAIAFPGRMALPGLERLDLVKVGRLDFEAPDAVRFPALSLARAAAESGGRSCIGLNGANEAAVAAFLQERIGFLGIAEVVRDVLERLSGASGDAEPSGFEEVFAIDAQTRAYAEEAIGRLAR